MRNVTNWSKLYPEYHYRMQVMNSPQNVAIAIKHALQMQLQPKG